MKVLAAVAALGVLALGVTSAAAQAAGPTGETLFKQRCALCHTPGKSTMGPDLTGLTTRKARPAYNYSPAMLKLPVRWNAAALDAFLAGPQKAVPGAKMMVSVPNAPDRAKIAGYLGSLK